MFVLRIPMSDLVKISFRGGVHRCFSSRVWTVHARRWRVILSIPPILSPQRALLPWLYPERSAAGPQLSFRAERAARRRGIAIIPTEGRASRYVQRQTLITQIPLAR